MKTFLFTFADKNFEKSALFQKTFSISKNFNNHMIFTPNDLESDFVERNYETLNYERGSGFWVWKPKIILSGMENLSPEDIVLYLDAGVLPKKDAFFFQNLASDNCIHIWAENDDFRNYQWIDPNVAKFMGLNEIDLEQKHFWAGAICSRNTAEFRSILQTWLEFCENSQLIRPETFPDYVPEGRLIWHRHDQALLNALVCQREELFRKHAIGDPDNSKCLFVAHRRGDITSSSKLYLFIIMRKVKRLVNTFLPRRMKNWLNMKTTKGRKPYLSDNEFYRNQTLF